jgi:hypothetical protein
MRMKRLLDLFKKNRGWIIIPAAVAAMEPLVRES